MSDSTRLCCSHVNDSPDRTAHRREPVTCGIPWPRGALRDPAGLVLRCEQGRRVPLQARILESWPDRLGAVGSARLAGGHCGRGHGRLPGRDRQESSGRLGISRGSGAAGRVKAGARRRSGPVHDRCRGSFSVRGGHGRGAAGDRPAIDAARTGFTVIDEAGQTFQPKLGRMELAEQGPLAAVAIEGRLVRRAASRSAASLAGCISTRGSRRSAST